MPYRLFALLIVLLGLWGGSSFALADDNFALVISGNNNLVVFGPKGERAAEISSPTISQSVVIGGTTFQVSYGRDANDLLTAILAPSTGQPLHFSVSGKTVEANNGAVVTLTFRDANHVSVDPGFVGTVAVNSEKVRHHDLAETAPAPKPLATPRLLPRTTADIQPRELPPLASHEPSAPVVEEKPAPKVVHTLAPPPLLSEKPAAVTSSAPLPSTTTSSSETENAGDLPPAPAQPLLGSEEARPPKTDLAKMDANKETLYWSEPVTSPDGHAPSVGLNAMVLVEVRGEVTIKSANGEEKHVTSGTPVPSGASVITSDKSSAAVFMGGVNSARLLPNTDVKVTQNLAGTVRHTVIDLDSGTVFSRVGHRVGETQDYSVKTPEGVAAARGTEFADHRGKGKDGNIHHYVFVTKGVVECFMEGQSYKLVAGRFAFLGSASMPPINDNEAILHTILVILQPFNEKLAAVIDRINNGTATPTDQAFYDTLVNTFLGGQLPSILQKYQNTLNPLQNIIPAARRALNQDLQPFGTVPLTPF